MVGNIFVRFGNKVFRQLFRIPMRTILLLICVLYCYESQYIGELQNDPSRHSQISLFCGYLDDILAANNSNVLLHVKQIFQGIYV